MNQESCNHNDLLSRLVSGAFKSCKLMKDLLISQSGQ